MLGTKKKEETLPVNESLLNVITPMGLEIKRNSLVIGENMGKVYGAVRYPQKVEMGWLSKITNIPSTIVSVGITPIDNSTLISALSKSIVQQRGAADSAKDPLTRQRAEKAAEDGEHIMQKIDQEGETVAMMSLTVMPVAQDEAAFSKICRRVESAFSVQKCKVRTLANLQPRQWDGGQHCFPHHPHEYLCGRFPLRKLRLQRRPGLLFCQGQQWRAGDSGPLDTRERPHQQQLRCHGCGRYRQKHRGQAYHAV